MSTFMASWPGGQTAWDTEDAAQAEADRRVREGAPHAVVYEIGDLRAAGTEVAPGATEGAATTETGAQGRVGRFWRGRGSK